MVRALTDGYPLIDGIEILSPEQGGDCPTFDAAELDSRLRDYFGPAAVLPDSKPQSISAALAGAMLSLKLAKEIYTTPTSLARLFKKHMGMSILTYLHTVRINHAIKLLKTGEMSISEIAKEVGYENINNFYKYFKRFNGMTPAEFVSR